jgi:hypothetical protein
MNATENWRPGEYAVRNVAAPETETVAGSVNSCGLLGIHEKRQGNCGYWSLTHIPTGGMLLWADTPEPLFKLGDMLSSPICRECLKSCRGGGKWENHAHKRIILNLIRKFKREFRS